MLHNTEHRFVYILIGDRPYLVNAAVFPRGFDLIRNVDDLIEESHPNAAESVVRNSLEHLGIFDSEFFIRDHRAEAGVNEIGVGAFLIGYIVMVRIAILYKILVGELEYPLHNAMQALRPRRR